MNPMYVLGRLVGLTVGAFATGVLDGAFGTPDPVDASYTPTPTPVPAPTCLRVAA